MRAERDTQTDSAMTCEEMRDLMPLLAHCRLRGPKRDRALSHLAHCSRCRVELAEFLKTADLVADHVSRLPGPPPGSWERLRIALESDPVQRASLKRQTYRFAAGLTFLLRIGGVPEAFADLCGSAVEFWAVSRATRHKTETCT